ncbi:hypothetical protein [Glutamicibacter sp.]|uniref:hypothetical protein n=1 Tax=Glutamicibacter sp. TaxID=1931995 RepID=UPI003D6A9DFD
MRKILQGQWVVATLSGLGVTGIGLFATRLLEAPSWSYAIALALGVIAFVLLAFFIDRIGAKKMGTEKTNSDETQYGSMVRATDCVGLTITNSSVPKGMAILDAKNTKGIRLDNNEQRDDPK